MSAGLDCHHNKEGSYSMAKKDCRGRYRQNILCECPLVTAARPDSEAARADVTHGKLEHFKIGHMLCHVRTCCAHWTRVGALYTRQQGHCWATRQSRKLTRSFLISKQSMGKENPFLYRDSSLVLARLRM